MGFFLKERTIGQALAPCGCRLLCGQRACLSRTLYGGFIIADFLFLTSSKTHRQIFWTKADFSAKMFTDVNIFFKNYGE